MPIFYFTICNCWTHTAFTFDLKANVGLYTLKHWFKNDWTDGSIEAE